MEKYGNNDFVVDDDIVLIDNSYYISFAGFLKDSWGNLPIETSTNLYINDDYLEINNGTLMYNIGDYLKLAAIIRMDIDVLLLEQTKLDNCVLIGGTEYILSDNQRPPYIIFIPYDDFHGSNSIYKNVIYVCGLPQQSIGGKYQEYYINQWHTLTMIWNTLEKRCYGLIDGVNISKDWDYASRPNYNTIPTIIRFGSLQNPYQFHGRIKNFKISIIQ